jgi:flavin reductase (DIM6/NTAB) family NADH-FMN oxidoreductase RutF
MSSPTDSSPTDSSPTDSSPTDSLDRLRRRVLWKMPTGLYLLGSVAGDRRNLMTLNLAVQVALTPKLVGVSVEVHAHTHELVHQGGVFALSILKREDRTVVRKFVKPVDASDIEVGEDGQTTMRGQPVRSDKTGAPILASAAAWLDCRVTNELPLGSHTFFIGEVVGFGFTDGGEEAEILRMEDTRMNYGG